MKKLLIALVGVLAFQGYVFPNHGKSARRTRRLGALISQMILPAGTRLLDGIPRIRGW